MLVSMIISISSVTIEVHVYLFVHVHCNYTEVKLVCSFVVNTKLGKGLWVSFPFVNLNLMFA